MILSRPVIFSEIVEGSLEEVFDFWFFPEQVLPPIKEVLSLDFKVKGTFQILMKLGESEFNVFGRFEDIVKPEKITYLWMWENQLFLTRVVLRELGKSVQMQVNVSQYNEVVNKKLLVLMQLQINSIKMFFNKKRKESKEGREGGVAQ